MDRKQLQDKEEQDKLEKGLSGQMLVDPRKKVKNEDKVSLSEESLHEEDLPITMKKVSRIKRKKKKTRKTGSLRVHFARRREGEDKEMSQEARAKESKKKMKRIRK